MENTLAQSIFKTLAFFDIFDYPLTREELFLYLWQPPSQMTYSDFVVSLGEGVPRGVETQSGYYFFLGKSETIAKRERKTLYLEQKIKIAKRAARKLRYIPFVEALFVCNVLPVVVKSSSDIDVLLIVKENRIWLSRFLTSVCLTLFRLRPTNFGLHFFSKSSKKSMTDKICLSFYITKNHLDLADICVGGDDVYQAYWNTTLIPLYDRAYLYRKFYEQNTWVQKYLPNTILGYHLLSRWKILDTGFSHAVKSVGEWILGASFFENKLRILQHKHVQQRETVENQSVEKSIVISDMMLKFHKNDRKKQFQSEWKVKWQQYI